MRISKGRMQRIRKENGEELHTTRIYRAVQFALRHWNTVVRPK